MSEQSPSTNNLLRLYNMQQLFDSQGEDGRCRCLWRRIWWRRKRREPQGFWREEADIESNLLIEAQASLDPVGAQKLTRFCLYIITCRYTEAKIWAGSIRVAPLAPKCCPLYGQATGTQSRVHVDQAMSEKRLERDEWLVDPLKGTFWLKNRSNDSKDKSSC